MQGKSTKTNQWGPGTNYQHNDIATAALSIIHDPEPGSFMIHRTRSQAKISILNFFTLRTPPLLLHACSSPWLPQELQTLSLTLLFRLPNCSTSTTCGRFSPRLRSSPSSRQDGERVAVVLDQTVLYPQGGGQPFDTGSIETLDGTIKFCVTDVRAKSGVVYHYGNYDKDTETESDGFKPGDEVKIAVDETRRTLNSRLHSAGHLLDACMRNIGLETLEPGKGHHFPDSPFVEYKGAIPSTDLENKRVALESEVNRLVTLGGQVRAMIAPYSEAAAFCGGSLPDYVAKDSCPRIVCLGENPGCPCGGTHVSDISEVGEVKVTQIRVKKGVSKVCYNLASSMA